MLKKGGKKMEIEIIKGMIDNSTWIDPEKQTTYKFAENNQLFINGKNHMQYNVKKSKNQILIQLGSGSMYIIEYVNDFILYLHNFKERFMITPA
jgi:hypothetical protein